MLLIENILFNSDIFMYFNNTHTQFIYLLSLCVHSYTNSKFILNIRLSKKKIAHSTNSITVVLPQINWETHGHRFTSIDILKPIP